MNDAATMNRAWWAQATPQYSASRFYDVEGFLGGKSTLGRIELDAVGDVADKLAPDVFQGFERNGLTVREMREYPFCGYAYLPDMTKADDGYYHRPEGALAVPLLLAFKAAW